MREILFRGKDIKGNWYEGLLAHNMAKDEWYISNKAGISTAYQVRPETIGQYTGLTDKNGTKIFEGDIVLITKNTVTDVVAKIFYSEGAFRTNAANTYDGEEPLSFWLANDCDFEVIGNIYDNSELIGGK